jgi:hypothetical protein
LINHKLDLQVRGGIPRALCVCACFIKAWNTWVRGERTKLLRFSMSVEKFPGVE